MNTLQHKIAYGLLVIALAAGAALAYSRFKSPEAINEPLPLNQNPGIRAPIETTLFFAGDIMLSRNVASAMYKANDVNLPYLGTLDRIKDADIAFANLESPFNNTGSHSVQGSLVFNADPKFVDGLKNAGFDILSTANNHGYDQGKFGLTYTIDLLKQNGIQPVGTGLDCHDGVIMEADGMKFGFLAYSYAAFNDGGRVPDPMVCDWNNQRQVTQDIANIRAKVDYLIVSSHMGAEYKRTPEEFNAEGARNAIGTGADLFIGHHPHWVQTTEHYTTPDGARSGWIFYSLGNFVFDQMWSQDTREGIAVNVTFHDKSLSRIQLLPVVIDNYCCPRWANDAESKAILNKINLESPLLFTDNKVY